MKIKIEVDVGCIQEISEKDNTFNHYCFIGNTLP